MKYKSVVLLLTLAVSNTHAGLTDTLYVTDGDAGRLAIVEGATATILNIAQGSYPLAVRDTIWMTGYREGGAIEYDLSGVETGSTGDVNNGLDFIDGAVNGDANYAIQNAFNAGTQASVYRTDADWSNPVELFSLASASSSRLMGITFDTIEGVLWILGRGELYKYALDGTLLDQIALDDKNLEGGLAYEGSSDSLWIVDNNSDFVINFDKNGNQIQFVEVPNLSSNNWGAEFKYVEKQVTDKPVTANPVTNDSSGGLSLISLLTLGGLLLTRKRKFLH